MRKQRILGHLLFLCSANWIYGQNQIAAQHTSVHVLVNARRLTGAPISNLRSSDLTVTAFGAPVHVAFSGYPAGQPTFVLLIVAPSSGYASLSAIQTMLASNLPHDNRPAYLFATLGPKGEYLPFRAGTNLIRDFVSAKIVYRGYLQAIQDLATCKGRRAILYLTNRLSNPPPDLIASAKDAGAIIYDVGGDSRQNYKYEGGSFTTFPPPNATQGTTYGPISTTDMSGSHPGNAVIWESNAIKDVRTVYVASSLGNAFHEINHDLKGFYELELTVLKGTQSLSLLPKIGGEYQVSAFVYSESTQPLPVLTVTK